MEIDRLPSASKNLKKFCIALIVDTTCLAFSYFEIREGAFLGNEFLCVRAINSSKVGLFILVSIKSLKSFFVMTIGLTTGGLGVVTSKIKFPLIVGMTTFLGAISSDSLGMCL